MTPVATRFSLWPTPWKRDDGGHSLTGEVLPSGYYALVFEVSGGDQVWLCVLGGAMALLNNSFL
jgi:hypothetical protein